MFVTKNYLAKFLLDWKKKEIDESPEYSTTGHKSVMERFIDNILSGNAKRTVRDEIKNLKKRLSDQEDKFEQLVKKLGLEYKTVESKTGFIKLNRQPLIKK